MEAAIISRGVDDVAAEGHVKRLSLVALSAAIHADAVACAAKDVDDVLHQIAQEESNAEQLEMQLEHMLQMSQRRHAITAAVERSKEERIRGAAARTQGTALSPTPASTKRMQSTRRSTSTSSPRATGATSSSSPSPPRTEAMSVQELTRLALSAVEVDALPPSSSAAPHAATTTTTTTHDGGVVPSSTAIEEMTMEELDHHIDQLQLTIRRNAEDSLLSRLARLEQMKQRVCGISPNNILRELVDPFTYSSDVEALWKPSNNNNNNKTSADISSSTTCTINATNVEQYITNACQRLAGRLVDAMNTLARAELNEQSEPHKIHASMLYASALTSEDFFPAVAVQELQHDGVAKLVAAATPTPSSSATNVDGSSSSSSSSPHASVLHGCSEYSGLNPHWTQVAGIDHVPSNSVLPPARHILTQRFSAANVAELQRVFSQRVEVQRCLIRDYVDEAQLLNEALPEPCSARELATAMTRLAQHDASPPGSSYVWPSIYVPMMLDHDGGST